MSISSEVYWHLLGTITDREIADMFGAKRASVACARRRKGLSPATPPDRTAERFWSKVNKDGPTMLHMETPCWEWTAARRIHGYGVFGVAAGDLRPAHRYAYEAVVGPIPAGMYACHRCDNPPCVNPDHIFIGTPADNVRDMHAKGREARGDRVTNRGEKSGMAVLTAAQVTEIRTRKAAGESHMALARAFGVSKATIKDIARGRSWTHLGLGGPIDGTDTRKLTDEQWVAIAADPRSHRVIAREYGVSRSAVWHTKRKMRRDAA